MVRRLFERARHQRIELVLNALDGDILRAHQCLFAGGTAIALRFGEYRESVDIDFLVSNIDCYRNLRQLLTGKNDINAIVRHDAEPLVQEREIRAVRDGIRTFINMDGLSIKFEIVSEGRVTFEPPTAEDVVCGISTLTQVDMVTSKLLANTDRWRDEGVFSRDLIDLAMMTPSLTLLRTAVAKAETAYGAAILRDLERAITHIEDHREWLQRCMQVMAMAQPPAVVWKSIRALRRVFR